MFNKFTDFLITHRNQVEALEIAAGDAWWDANITGNADDENRAATLQKQIQRIYANRDVYAYLVNLNPETLSSDEARQHVLLKNAFLSNQIDVSVIDELVDTESRVESCYNNFRATLNGETVTNNQIYDILEKSTDNAHRQAAWEASKTIGIHVETDVRRLIELRNREAVRLGFPNYYAMSLQLQELNVETLFALLDKMKTATDSLWNAYKTKLDVELAQKFGVMVENLRPWHYGDPFFQEAPPSELNLDAFYADKDLETITAAFFRAVGLPIESILARSDLYEKPGKCQHGFCIHVGRFTDVRVLCNCTQSERWMSTLLHEFGHAVYDFYLGNDSTPFFLREVAHTLSTEAIAMLFGRFSRNAQWLIHWADVPTATAHSIEARAKRELGDGFLIFTRWVLVMTHFERGMYENPERDLNAFWWETVAKFQNLTKPEDRDAPDWAAKLHIALSPVYYHSYLMGEMFASQLLNDIRVELGNYDDTELVTTDKLGLYLKEEIFLSAARRDWNELAIYATGEKLNPTYLLRDMAH